MTTVLVFLVIGIVAYVFLVREKYALNVPLSGATPSAGIEPEMAR